MKEHEVIQIHLRYFATLVIEVAAEWQDHINEFISSPDFDSSWVNDKIKMMKLITGPLREAWQGKARSGWEWDINTKTSIKNALQYILNADEHIPYTPYAQMPGLMLKQGGACERAFSKVPPDLVAPQDNYMFCQWMWEALFPDEDWHTDVSNWVIAD